MPIIPRQVKPPARIGLSFKVPEAMATMLKHYAEFLDSSQEYVVTETLRLTFRRDREFQAWLSATHPDTRMVASATSAARGGQSDQTHGSAGASTSARTSRHTALISEQHRSGLDSKPLPSEEH
jgi:hypothetical protein